MVLLGVGGFVAAETGGDGNDQPGTRSAGDPSTSHTAKPSGRPSVVPAPGGGTIKQRIPARPTGKVVNAGAEPTVRLPDGVVVHRSALVRRKVKAGGPGEVAGEAVVVHLRLTNDSAKRINLDTVMVGLRQPDGQVPLPLTADPYAPFTGTLDPGKSAIGSYVYSARRSRNDRWVMFVQYVAGAGIARFDVQG